jgi:hypothetical protein
MKTPEIASRKSLVLFGVAALFAVTAAAAQVVTGAAPGTTGIDASGSYQHEVQSCLSGRTQEDQATCLREARNAQAERRRGDLDVAGQSQYQANAMQRCNALNGEDKAACQARMMGYGETSGSVAGGGVLREVETVVVPPGADSVRIQPQTPDPVVIVPEQK